jgi:hypothetical protein
VPNLPALILAYLRPEGVERLVRDLASQGVPRIYISIDGAKDDDGKIRQLQLRQQIRELKDEFLDIEFKVRVCGSNLGSGAGVFSGVDWFFENEDSGIILEDDLIIGKRIIQYFEKLLIDLSNQKDVGMITGSKLFNNNEDYCWTTYPIVWGWATWRNRWLELKEGMLSEEFKANRNLMVASERNYWKIGRRRSLSLAIDAWDIPFASEFHNREMKCVILPENQVTNVGMDSQATHKMNDGWPLGIPLGSKTFEANQDVIELISHTIPEDSLMRSRLYLIRPHHILSYFFGILRLRLQNKGKDINAFKKKIEAARFEYE